MSGSYYNLQQKYLTILALESQSTSDPNLQDVITVSPNLDGIAPTSGQAITYDGTDVVWGDVTTPTPNLQQVIDVSFNLDGTAPTSGQAITYDGTNVVWGDVITPTPNLQEVTDISNVTTNNIKLIGGLDYNEISYVSNYIFASKNSLTPTPFISSETLIDDFSSSQFSRTQLYSQVEVGNIYHAGLSLQNIDYNLFANERQLTISSSSASLAISCDAGIPQFLINDSSGNVGQVLGNTLSGINWVDLPTTPNLQEVTDISNVTTNDMAITDGLQLLDLKKDGVTMNEYSTTKIASYGLNGFSISNPNSYITEINANLTSGLNITNDTSNLVATSNSIDISGAVGLAQIDPSNGLVFTKSAVVGKLTNDQVFFTDGTDISTYKRLEMNLVSGNYSNTITQNDIHLIGSVDVILTTEKLEFNAEKGLYSIGDNLTISCPDGLDLSLNALSINGVQGDMGQVLMGTGAGTAPQWIELNNLICNGSVATPGISGSVYFSTFSASFTYTPTVILTVVSGSTNTYIANLVSVSEIKFTYTISGDGCSFLNFIAL